MRKEAFICDLCERELDRSDVYGVQKASLESARIIILVRVLEHDAHGTDRHVCMDCVKDIRETR